LAHVCLRECGAIVPYFPDALAKDVRALISGKRIPPWPAEHAGSDS